jgi:hypothetical protein
VFGPNQDAMRIRDSHRCVANFHRGPFRALGYPTSSTPLSGYPALGLGNTRVQYNRPVAFKHKGIWHHKRGVAENARNKRSLTNPSSV